MALFLRRVMLGLGVAVAMPVVLGSRSAEAQPGPGATANTRAEARKLVDEGIAAQNAEDYGKAIALYLRAFSLDPHPLLLFNVAQAHRLAGCPQRAVPFYERYLTLDPEGAESAPARAALAEIQEAARPDGPDCAKDSAEAAPPEVAPPAAAPVTADDRPLPPSRPSRVPPVLFWVGGGLALAGSGIAFYLGQQGGQDHPEDPYIYRGATPAGFVLAGVGAASIGVGIWWWMRGSRESAPVASIGPGGGYLGWQGRF